MVRIIYSKLKLFGVLLILGLTILGSKAQAAEDEYPVSLFCSPEEIEADISGGFTQTPRAITVIACEMTSTTKDRSISAFLLGKQTFEGSSLSSLGSDVSLTGSTPLTTTLPFPAVFQNGEYQYTFSLIEKGTQKVLAQESYLVGTIKEDTPQAKILSAIISEGRHEWQAPFDLTTTLDIPDGYDFRSNPLSLHVGMQDTRGKECAVLLQRHYILTKETQKLGLIFPEEGSCVNGMVVSLRDKTNTVIDQKILAIGLPDKLPAKEVSSPIKENTGILDTVPLAVQVGLVITLLLILTLGGYFFLRKQKRRF